MRLSAEGVRVKNPVLLSRELTAPSDAIDRLFLVIERHILFPVERVRKVFSSNSQLFRIPLNERSPDTRLRRPMMYLWHKE